MRCRRAKAEPEPCLRYFSKRRAIGFDGKAQNHINSNGRFVLEYFDCPALCSANLFFISLVEPIYKLLSNLLRKIYTKYIDALSIVLRR